MTARSVASFVQPFSVAGLSEGRFHDLGLERGNDGIRHSLFLTIKPITGQIMLSDFYSLGGCCRVFLAVEENTTVGAMFCSLADATTISGSILRVSIGDKEQRGDFEPSFLLERVSLYPYIEPRGSLLVIPKTPTAPFLVPVDK